MENRVCRTSFTRSNAQPGGAKHRARASMDLKTASVRRDIVLMVIVAGAAAYACAKFNLSEALLNWTRPFERLQLDELPAILLVIAICLIWFARRRYAEASRQLE